ncbi:MAG: asparagine synthase-related protein [Nitriliruptoraceae bacterium]
MSGVCAIVTFDGAPVGPDRLAPMLTAAPYRGLDGTGSWFGDGAGLAQQLLRTTGDELAAPVVDGDLAVVADARLDNRSALLAALHPTRTDCTDAQLIAAAYRRWGTGFAARLLGDFAIVIWDDRARRLVAARDPMAMRMLAYHHTPRRTVVATEVKQVLAGPDVPARLDEAHVAADLIGHFGRPNWSAYEEVEVLAPGQVLELDRDGLRVRPFWSPDPGHRIWHRQPGDYAEHLRELFTDAVAARLRTDRTAGVLLSGGVDSGSVAATAGWLLERGAASAPGVHACTWIFDELEACDERGVARAIAAPYGLEHSEVVADGLWPLRDFPAHGPPRDEPFVGAFQPMIDAGLTTLRRAGARVVLGGDRGDLMIGWTGFRYLPLAKQRRWQALRTELAEHRTATGQPMWELARAHLLSPAAARLGSRARRLARRPRPGGNGNVGPLPPWVEPAFAARHGLAELIGAGSVAPPGFGPSRALRHDWVLAQLHLRGMAWSERSYAQQGLVFADPFSDRRLAEFAMAVPQAAITPPGDNTKPLMRAAMRGILPPTALRDAGKVIPRPLYERGLLQEGTATVRHLLDGMETARRGWINERQMHEQFARSLHGAAVPAAFWPTLVTEWWVRLYAA